MRRVRARARPRSFVPRGPIRPVASALGARCEARARRCRRRHVAGRRGQRRRGARKHRRRAAGVARQSGVLDAVRALHQGIRSPAPGGFARARSPVSGARTLRGRPGAPRAPGREPHRDPPRCRRLARAADRRPRDRRLGVRSARGPKRARRCLAAAPARGGARAESLHRAAPRICTCRTAARDLRALGRIGNAPGGHRGDGAPVLHHRVRVRGNRRTKAGR